MSSQQTMIGYMVEQLRKGNADLKNADPNKLNKEAHKAELEDVKDLKTAIAIDQAIEANLRMATYYGLKLAEVPSQKEARRIAESPEERKFFSSKK